MLVSLAGIALLVLDAFPRLSQRKAGKTRGPSLQALSNGGRIGPSVLRNSCLAAPKTELSRLQIANLPMERVELLLHPCGPETILASLEAASKLIIK